MDDPMDAHGPDTRHQTRIPVLDVLELVQEGLSFADVVRDYYPDLTPDDIRACIQYARTIIAAEDLHVSTS